MLSRNLKWPTPTDLCDPKTRFNLRTIQWVFCRHLLSVTLQTIVQRHPCFLAFRLRFVPSPKVPNLMLARRAQKRRWRSRKHLSSLIRWEKQILHFQPRNWFSCLLLHWVRNHPLTLEPLIDSSIDLLILRTPHCSASLNYFVADWTQGRRGKSWGWIHSFHVRETDFTE